MKTFDNKYNAQRPSLIYRFDDDHLETVKSNVPLELFETKQWLAWRWHWDGERWTKAPFSVDNLSRIASPTDPALWVTGKHAHLTLSVALSDEDIDEAEHPDGLNFAISKDSAFFAVDFDDCRNPDTGDISAEVMKHIKGFNSYTEISPSGRGIRIFAKCEERPFCYKKTNLKSGGEVEYFGYKHTASVTGRALDGFNRLEQIEPLRLAKWIHNTFDKDNVKPVAPEKVSATRNSLNISEAELNALKSKIESSKQSDKFKTLLASGGDRSRGEAELIATLMFWCQNDPDLIEAFIRRFGSYREKWDTQRGTQNYLRYSIENVLSNGLAKETLNSVTVTEERYISNSHLEINNKLLKTFWEIEAMPPLTYQLDSILPEKSFAVLFGEPGAGKSFVALDMALSIAAGSDYHGHAVSEGRVVYVAAEGVTGLRKRVRAWFANHSELDIHRVIENVSFVAEPVQFSDAAAVGSLLSELKTLPETPSLIVIDTLARCHLGRDENSSRDVGEFIAACDRLKENMGATVLVLHHTSASGERERGSTALRGAADAMFKIEAAKKDERIESIKLKCSKAKDAAPFSALSFTLESDVESDSVYLLKSESDGSGYRQLRPNETKVLEALKGDALSPSQIQERSKVSRTETQRALKFLEERQLISRVSRGLYRQTDAQTPLLTNEDPFED